MFTIYSVNPTDFTYTEELASNLSYGELCQYLLDCYREYLPDEEVAEIEKILYEQQEYSIYRMLEDFLYMNYYILAVEKQKE